jgi:hypothetical protein
VNASFAELGIHYGIVTSECQHKICKYLSCLKNHLLLIFYFRRMSAEAEKEKGLCETNFDLNLSSEIDV